MGLCPLAAASCDACYPRSGDPPALTNLLKGRLCSETTLSPEPLLSTILFVAKITSKKHPLLEMLF